MKSTFRPAVLLMSGRMVGFGVNFLLPLVMVRIFNQADFGTYKQVFLIYTTLYGVAQIGMAESLYYFLPLAPEKSGRYVSSSILALAAAGLCSWGMLVMAGEKIGRWLINPTLAQYMGLLGLYLWFTLASAPLEIVMIARRKFLRASIFYALSDVIRTALFLLPALLYRHLRELLLGGVAFAALRLFTTVFYTIREFGSDLWPDTAASRRQLAYALPFELWVVTEMLNTTLPQFAVAHSFDAATFAIFSVGCLQVPLVDFVLTSVSNVLMVRMGEEIRDGRSEAVLSIWHDSARKLCLIFFPLVALLLLSARELIVLMFTANYGSSVPLFMLWCPMILLAALQTDGALRVYADTRILFGLSMVRLLLLVSLTAWVLRGYGLIGVVVLAVTAAAVSKALALWRLKNQMQATLADFLPWGSLRTILGCATVAAAPALFIKWRFDMPAVPMIFTTSALYTTLYFTLLHRRSQVNLWQLWDEVLARLGHPARTLITGEMVKAQEAETL